MGVPVILDFCANCGILLESGIVYCPNCVANVEPTEARIPGTFTEEDAERLKNAGVGLEGEDD